MNSPTNVIQAFSDEEAGQLADLSTRQLRYWDTTGFFEPSLGFERRRSPNSRIYSFRDVVSLRTISLLRKKHDVPLQHLRDVARELTRLGDDFWVGTRLFVVDRRVFFKEPDTGRVRSAVGGQYTMLELAAVANDVAKRAGKLLKRKPSQIGRISQHRYVAHNKRVLAGTRIPVLAIQRFSDAGYSIPQILKEYPSLKRKDVEAALGCRGEKRIG